MAKRTTTGLGTDPLDAMVPDKPSGTGAGGPKPSKPSESDAGERKAKFASYVPAELADRARRVVYWTPGLTLAALLEDGLGRAVRDAEKANGGPFPETGGKLPTGRPVT